MFNTLTKVTRMREHVERSARYSRVRKQVRAVVKRID